jgi:ABC-type glycerol-3-phosphate transport system substrate-binding protein
MLNIRTPGMSRRAFFKWMAVGATGAVLAACAPAVQQAGGDSAGGTAGAAAQELKILVCCYTPPETELRQRYNTQFMEANPGVSLSMELLPAG